MGRPLKIKKSTTKDIGFNPWSVLTAPVVPTGFTPGSTTQYGGVVGGEGNGGGVATATYPVVKCRVFIAGQSEEDGWIVRQKGTIQYLVEGASSGAQGICTLANQAQGALTSGNMNIAFTDDASTEVLISKLTNKFALDYSTPPVRFAVNFFTDEGTEIKSGTRGQLANTATQQNILDLALVEKYTS
jgi:hypothetical protein